MRLAYLPVRGLLVTLISSLALAVVAGEGRQIRDVRRVAEIAAFLPDDPGFHEVRVDNRAFWESMRPSKAGVVAEARRVMSLPVPRLTDYDILDPRLHGKYSNNIWKRLDALRALTEAECLENRGEFLPKVEEYLLALADQRLWFMADWDRAGAFLGKRILIDLTTASIGSGVAVTLDALKGRISPEVDRLVRWACRRNVIEPYFEDAADGWLGYDDWFYGRENWNPYCHYGVLACGLRLLDDRLERAMLIEAAERAVPHYVGGYAEDGYCPEGPDYWNLGSECFLRLGLLVRSVTSGRVDYFADPRAKRNFLYANGVQLTTGVAAQFGDSAANPSGTVYLLAELVWPETRCRYVSEFGPQFFSVDKGDLLRLAPHAFRTDKPDRKPFAFDRRTWFPTAQLYVGRPAKAGVDRLSVCLNAGFNSATHSHNDIGQYVVAVGGVPVAEDPGDQPYDENSFTSRRYESKMYNSWGHAVPYVGRPYPGGILQKHGRQHGARVLKTEFTDAVDTLVVDLAPAYDDPRIRSLVRTFVFDRGKNAVTVSDRGDFTEPLAFESPVVTLGSVKRGTSADAFTLVQKGRKLSLAVSTDGAKWHADEQEVPNPRGVNKPRRLAIVLDRPTTHPRIDVVFRCDDGPMKSAPAWTLAEPRNLDKGAFEIPAQEAVRDVSGFTVQMTVRFGDVVDRTFMPLLSHELGDTGWGLGVMKCSSCGNPVVMRCNGATHGVSYGMGSVKPGSTHTFVFAVRKGIIAVYMDGRRQCDFLMKPTPVPESEPIRVGQWDAEKWKNELFFGPKRMEGLVVEDLRFWGPDEEFYLPGESHETAVGFAGGKGWMLEVPTKPLPEKPNLLIYGDSISDGYAGAARMELGDEMNVYHWTHSETRIDRIDDHLYEQVLAYAKFDVIAFNNGAHSYHWTEGGATDEKIAANYRKLVAAFRKGAPHAKLLFLSTTPYTALKGPSGKVEGLGEKNDCVLRLNRVACGVMAAEGIPVVDVYGLMCANLQEARGDQYHFNPPAYVKLAKAVCDQARGLVRLKTDPKKETIR